MTASAVTFDELEARTHSALAVTIGARQALRQTGLRLGMFATGLSAVVRLRRVVQGLNEIDFEEGLEDGDEPWLRKIVSHLAELHEDLLDLLAKVREKGLDRSFVYGPVFRDIEASGERIGDVLESFELSLSKEFRDLLRQEIRELQPTKTEPADWRSSLATLRD